MRPGVRELLDEINDRLVRYERALNEIAKMEPSKVADGFVTGPAAMLMACKRIAAMALKKGHST